MDRKKLHKDNTGMTLLEVIVAVSIFAIAATVLLQSFVTSSRINKKSNLYLEATSQWGKGFKIVIFFPKLRSNGGK